MNIWQNNLNLMWSTLIIDQLIRRGHGPFIISPGHRCAPLIMALNQFDTEKIMARDERAGAYIAIGCAQGNLRPVLICTSGTALANYYPAILEAEKQRLPITLLTADRPPEEWDTGSNQTLNQQKIFAQGIVHFCHLPCPFENLKYLTAQVAQSSMRGIYPIPSPVHINVPLRPPLNNHIDSIAQSLIEEAKDILDGPLFPQFLFRAKHTLHPYKKGLIVVGEKVSFTEKQLEKFCKKVPWPIFFDITSQFAHLKLPRRLPSPDLISWTNLFKNNPPEVIIHLGGKVVAKKYHDYAKTVPVILVNPREEKQDPSHNVSLRILCHEGDFLETNSLERPEYSIPPYQTPPKNSFLTTIDTLFDSLKENSSVTVANSSLIRLMDRYIVPQKKYYWAFNRGVSGIEGLLATSIGHSLAHQAPGVLLIGDISLLHDLNSLSMVAKHPYPLIIIVFNNFGGEIFKKISLERDLPLTENFVTTPHKWGFQKVCEQFEIDYFKEDNDLKDILKRNQTCLIEIFCENEEWPKAGPLK